MGEIGPRYHFRLSSLLPVPASLSLLPSSSVMPCGSILRPPPPGDHSGAAGEGGCRGFTRQEGFVSVRNVNGGWKHPGAVSWVLGGQAGGGR